MLKSKIFITIVFVLLLVGDWTAPREASAELTSQDQAIGSRLSDYERLKDCTKIKQNPPKICLQVPFGGKTDVTGIAEYINLFYRFFVGIVVTFAIFMIVVNGFKWLFSRGNSGIVDSARKGIGSAIGAVALVFVSVAMLRIINPDLISLEVPGLSKVATKVASGIEWCHQVPDNMTFVYKATGDIQEAGTKGSDLSCGEEYEFFDPNDPKKVKHQCTGSACFTGGHCNKESKECSPIFITGNVSVKEDSNNPTDHPYPVRMTLVPVCVLDGTTYKMLPGFSYLFSEDEGRFSTFQGEYNFFVDNDEYRKRQYYNECVVGSSASDYKFKFAVQVSIRDDEDPVSDDFLMKKGCSEPISTQSPSSYDQAIWAFASSNLYVTDDFRDSIICNLTIDRKTFPRR